VTPEAREMGRVFHHPSKPKPAAAWVLRFCARQARALFHVTGLVMVFTFLTPERRQAMKWTKPQYQDLRFGFEITMYISAR